jgi:hypothetical protein
MSFEVPDWRLPELAVAGKSKSAKSEERNKLKTDGPTKIESKIAHRRSHGSTKFVAFADVDDEFLITIHHWMKWYKFGFTRLWDNLSLEIRNGRMSRDEAIAIVREAGDETPYEEIERFCDYVGITKERFVESAERFRNKEIWSQRDDGAWWLRDFLIDNWEWNKGGIPPNQ